MEPFRTSSPICCPGSTHHRCPDGWIPHLSQIPSLFSSSWTNKVVATSHCQDHGNPTHAQWFPAGGDLSHGLPGPLPSRITPPSPCHRGRAGGGQKEVGEEDEERSRGRSTVEVRSAASVKHLLTSNHPVSRKSHAPSPSSARCAYHFICAVPSILLPVFTSHNGSPTPVRASCPAPSGGRPTSMESTSTLP